MSKTGGAARIWIVAVGAVIFALGLAVDRAAAAVTATFSNGVLTVFGDTLDNNDHDQPRRGREDPRQRRGGRGPRRHADGGQHQR